MIDQYIAAAQRAGEERLNLISEYEEAAEEGGGEIDGIESPAMAPWCGCPTCVVREVLDAAWPHFMAAAREEVADGA